MKRSISCKEFSSSELRYDSSALSVEDPPYIFLYLTCYFLDFWQLKCSSELPVNSFLVQLVIDINRTYALPLHCSLCQAWQLSSVKSTRWDLLLRKTFKLFNVFNPRNRLSCFLFLTCLYPNSSSIKYSWWIWWQPSGPVVCHNLLLHYGLTLRAVSMKFSSWIVVCLDPSFAVSSVHELEGDHQVQWFVESGFYTVALDWLYGQFLWNFRHEL